MTPKDITRLGVGDELRALLSGGHINELDCRRRHHIMDPVVFDIDMLRLLMMHWNHSKLTN